MADLYKEYRKQNPNTTPEVRHQKTKLGRPCEDMWKVYRESTYDKTLDKLRAEVSNRNPS